MNDYFDFSSDEFLMITTFKNDIISDEEIFFSILNNKKINDKFISYAEQVHSNKVEFISKPGTSLNSDGLITDRNSNLILVIKTADCIPIFIYDKIEGNYGMIHAGWRGIADRIHVNAIKNISNIGSKIKNISIVIGPSIKSCCYEIGEDLIKIFEEKHVVRKKNKNYLDLSDCIISDFKDLGINNIKLNEICTYEDHRCHSYRRESDVSGRMYSFITKK